VITMRGPLVWAGLAAAIILGPGQPGLALSPVPVQPIVVCQSAGVC